MPLPDLPESSFFTLQQICERWNCDEKRLLQYCQSNMLEIGVIFDGSDGYQIGTDLKKVHSQLSGFYALSSGDIESTFYWGEEPVDEFSCAVKKAYMPYGDGSTVCYDEEKGYVNTEFKLERTHIFSSNCLVITKLERDRFENVHNIDVSTIDDISNITEQSKMAVQEKRELILKGWLGSKDINNEHLLEYTQEEVWEILHKIDPKIFRSAAHETIKEFFKRQKLCKFKAGRRKGGI